MFFLLQEESCVCVIAVTVCTQTNSSTREISMRDASTQTTHVFKCESATQTENKEGTVTKYIHLANSVMLKDAPAKDIFPTTMCIINSCIHNPQMMIHAAIAQHPCCKIEDHHHQHHQRTITLRLR